MSEIPNENEFEENDQADLIDPESYGLHAVTGDSEVPESVTLPLVESNNDIQAPDGWLTRRALANELGVAFSVVKRISAPLQEEHPEWFHDYRFVSKRSSRIAEHLSPDLVETVRNEVMSVEPVPEGWRSKQSLSDELGIAPQTIAGVIDKYREEHPEWFQKFRNEHGRVFEYNSPEVIKILKSGIGSIEVVDTQWMTNKAVARLAQCGQASVTEIADEFREDHPDWFKQARGRGGQITEQYHPELIAKVREVLDPSLVNRDEWVNSHDLADEIGVGVGTVQKIVNSIADEYPNAIKRLGLGCGKLGRRGRIAAHYNNELADRVREIAKERVLDAPPAPEGWMTINKLTEDMGLSHRTIADACELFREEHPEWFATYKWQSGKVSRVNEHLSPELVQVIGEHFSQYAPLEEGWLTIAGIAKELGVKDLRIKFASSQYKEEHPEWFQVMRSKTGFYEHIHPDAIDQIRKDIGLQFVERRAKSERLKLASEFENFVSDVENETPETGDFRSLVSLFGSEKVVDILYQYHPEYRKIPVPYVKSIIADYLGDFLTTPGGLDLDNLEVGVQFLSDASLKDGLTEVVKQNCLSFYNQQRKAGLAAGDLEAILEHINDLRGQTAHFSTEELTSVFEEVESYYKSLFEDIHKPENLVDELNQGRSFPDLNQRINIHEMTTKHKMLIADEMGVGKSASAILTKEYLGVGLALIVAPSNVVDTWKNYLSDKVVDGEQIGYFKLGEAPRVLIVESSESLEGIDPSDYDYIVMSQERLNDRYMEALQGVNYGMLVVDEVHKMKNLISGKRAENLIKLAEGIDETDGAKYLSLLSGTPIPNKVGDISMVLKLLYPEKFEGVSNKEITNQILYGDALDLRSLLVPRMQMKSLAESIKMPELVEKIHHVELTAEEREMYEVLLEEDEITASQKLQILRKFSLSPSLLEATPDINGSKIQEVGAALRETFDDKDKVVMFVNGYIEGVIRGENTIVEALGLPEDVEVFAIEGEVEKEMRLAIQQQLQGTGRKMLVLVSGQTADVGVDFSGAEEVYFYNEPWTEYDKKQQLGRVYRPGLSDDLISRTFITKGTIEEGIHSYIGSKFKAVEKLLRGIPISDLEREMLKKSENQDDPNLEVNPALAEYYFSSWDRMMKIYGYVKELGEDDFVKFLGNYGREYADCYVDVGGRSYQANASRLSGTLIDRFTREKRKLPQSVKILDVASGPEMLRRHISNEFSDRVISLDINQHHFAEAGQNSVVGSFLNLPFADDSVDYANLSLALHYTNFVPTKGQYERIEVLQEMNRVLSVGGRAIISLMHTLDLKDEPAFREAITKLGFKVVEKYTGRTEDGSHFRTRLFTLEKTHDGPRDIKEAVSVLGSKLMKGFKFTKSKAKLRDSRKIATSFSIEGRQGIKTKFNEADQITLEEERVTQIQMTKLQRKYGSVKDIPRDEVLSGGFSRIFNGKSHVLFRRLVAGSGSVVLR
jgi:ubiquinone/menaquinone biosynthesis C-methylase UbiE/superfamily II DNA or RNA helicase